MLGKLRDTASAYLGCRVSEAVITVPAYFNDAQRTATLHAAAIAQIRVVRLVNEPTAAVLAAGVTNELHTSEPQQPQARTSRRRTRARRGERRQRRTSTSGSKGKSKTKAKAKSKSNIKTKAKTKARRRRRTKAPRHGQRQDVAEDMEGRPVLAFDLGGGTFDVSLMTVEGGVFEVRCRFFFLIFLFGSWGGAQS